MLQLWHAVVMLIWSFYTVVPRLYSLCPKLCGSVILLNTFFQICIFDVGGVMYVFLCMWQQEQECIQNDPFYFSALY